MIAPRNSWIRRMHPSELSQVRLFCLPHAGGSASAYFKLSELLGPRIEVLAVQYPGRQDRRNERCVESIPVLAEMIASAMAEWIDRPYAIFGHSMGAIIGFELALRLGSGGAGEPVHLFASGRRAPSTIRDERVHLLDDSGLVAELRRNGGTDQRLLADADLLSMILPATRSDYRAIENYVFTGSKLLSCPITALIGNTDRKCSLDEAAAWMRHTSAAFDLRTFEGGHFFLDANIEGVARGVSAALVGYGRNCPTDNP
ncbi:Surfactin synthase thioesterase subunit [Nocardia amikacinitolerans]|uniref:thioesterase II family protein n=2 Tax=Nocardia amikacinitolerans TaxID=756689 RepID=UPI0009FE08AF|nr:alpha/beta fold hydrolase [Nocardia amikacinitolerans]MCP2321468.1 Surfactin synthase thioesterase subunit [Nocardia amikacinitolerans]